MHLRSPGSLVRALITAGLVSGVLAWATPSAAQAPSPDDPTPQAPPAPVGISGLLSNSLVLRGNPAESTLITVLSAGYSWTPALSTFVRIGSVHNASSDTSSATGLANPALGASLQFPIGKHFIVGGTSGLTLPIGSGGGNGPSAAAFRAWNNSIDWGGAMFAVDHLDIFNGVRASFAAGALTVQFESILHELVRVRGEAIDPIGAAASVTGTTATVSYAVIPRLTLSTALSETRFWNTPVYITQSPDSRVDYFFSAGASTSLKLGALDLTPGLVYARALDLPLATSRFQVLEADIGFSL